MADYLAHPAVNHPKAREWVHDVHAIFPNLHIDTGQGGFYTHHFWPTSVNTTRYEVRFYMAHAQDARARFQQEAYLARVMEVLLEDLRTSNARSAASIPAARTKIGRAHV